MTSQALEARPNTTDHDDDDDHLTHIVCRWCIRDDGTQVALCGKDVTNHKDVEHLKLEEVCIVCKDLYNRITPHPHK